MSPFWISLELRIMEIALKTETIRCVNLSPPTNQHPTFYRPDMLPATQPKVSEHFREKVSHSTDLLISGSSQGFLTLSLTI